MAETDVPVLVVGAGPVGLLGARLLARRGIDVLVAEKHAKPLDAPKAHALNPRSLEICASAGLPMKALHEAATPTAQGASVRMMATLTTHEIGVLPYERQDEAVRALTPWPLINIQQPRFEALLEEAARSESRVTIRRGLEWLGCSHDAEGVVSVLRDRTTGEEHRVRARYLIAADGANSDVRRALDIAMDGPEVLQHHVMIHFEADLTRVVGDRPSILYFLFGPAAGVFIAYDIAKTWVLMHPHDPASAPLETFTDAVCRTIVDTAVGTPVPDMAIRGVRSWAMSAQVAARYRQGRAFLAGDAAHRFPPTGGLGLNTGIADIDNLAWKIAAVEKGWAGPGLLDTYEAERRTVAQVNMNQSLTNAMRMFALFQALGCMPGQIVPADEFAARLADPARRPEIEAAVEHQRDHFDSLRLQLGYAYGDALKDDDARPVSDFRPRAVPGARLPHVPLAEGRSTLDGVEHGAFTLLHAGPAAAWDKVSTALPVTLVALDQAAAQSLGIAPAGALLLRPDAHILARAEAPRGAGEMIAAANKLLGLVPATNGAA